MSTKRFPRLLATLALGTAGLAIVVLVLRSARTPVSASPTPGQSEGPPHPSLAPPTAHDVRSTVERVFGDTLVLERAVRDFVVGDFNGDESEDLAVPARPRPTRLRAVNDPLANWTIQDAEHPATMDAPEGRRHEAVKRNARLLTVIHGYGPGGWRDPEARQAYLVRNGPTRLCRVKHPQAVQALQPAGVRPPRLTGDVILEVEAASSRFLYWTGARYVWHTPSPTAKGGLAPARVGEKPP